MVRIDEQIHVAAPLERVWQTFTDLTCWQDWNSVLTQVEPKGEAYLLPGGRFRCCIRPYAVPVFFEARIEEVVPLKRVLWTARRLGLQGRHEFLFEPEADGVRVVSREVLTGFPVLLGGLFFPVGRFKRITSTFLRELKAGAEQSPG